MSHILSLFAIQSLSYLSGILGAYLFDRRFIIVAMLGYLLGLAVGVMLARWTSILFNLLGPHWFFLQELRQSIMTRANYPNEEYSCCCLRTHKELATLEDLVV